MAERKCKYHRESRMSRGGKNGDNDSLSFTRVSLLETFLSRKGMQESENPYPQGIQGHRTKRQMLHGLVLGFKLHLICNEKGELLNFMITPDDVDDREPLEYKAFVEFIYGKLVGDKGYIGKRLFERLFVDGIQLITKLKSNMKGALMSVSDKLLLRTRAIIETVNDELKNIAQVEHSRHRSFDNFVVNLLGGIAAYCYFPKKPSIRVQTVDMSNERQLTLF